MARKPRRSAETGLGLMQSGLIFGLCTWGVALYFFGFWSWIVLQSFLGWGGRTEFKTLLLGPMLGEWSLLSLLTTINVSWLLLLLVHAVRVRQSRSRRQGKAMAVIAVGVVLVAAMQLMVMNMRVAANTYDNDRILSDDEMIAHFADKKPAFVALVNVIKVHTTQLSNDERFNWFQLHIASEDYLRINKLQRAARTLRNLRVKNQGRWIEFESSRNGIGERARSKSYVYAEQAPQTLVSNLGTSAPSQKQYVGLRQIEENWFLRLSHIR